MIYAVNKRTKEHQILKNGTEAHAGRVVVGEPSGDLWEYVQADADGWIEWSGGECPLAKGVLCEIKFNDNDVSKCTHPELPRWEHEGSYGDIIAYRPILGENDMTTTAVDDQFAPDEGVWSGEGLPPVGIKCEIQRGEGLKWYEITVRGYSPKKDYMWMSDDGSEGEILTLTDGRYKFRPLRTDRELWIEEASVEIKKDAFLTTQQARFSAGCIYDALVNGNLATPEKTK